MSEATTPPSRPAGPTLDEQAVTYATATCQPPAGSTARQDAAYRTGVHQGASAVLTFLRSQGILAPLEPVDMTGWTADAILAELSRSYVYDRQVDWSAIEDLAVKAAIALVLEEHPDATTLRLAAGYPGEGWLLRDVILADGTEVAPDDELTDAIWQPLSDLGQRSRRIRHENDGDYLDVPTAPAPGPDDSPAQT